MLCVYTVLKRHRVNRRGEVVRKEVNREEAIK